MAKTIYLLVGASVEVTDDEYEKLRQMAYKPEDYDDYTYRDIITPPWLIEKIKSCGKIDGDGFISGEFWIEKGNS